MNIHWLHLTADDIRTETLQCEQEGRDLAPVREELEYLSSADLAVPALQRQAEALLDTTVQLPLLPDYPYDEPSDLDAIRAARPAPTAAGAGPVAVGELQNRVHGAWTGRCVGCLLGKPSEGWRRPAMWGYLKSLNRWPLDDYFVWNLVTPAITEEFGIHRRADFADLVDAMPEDDDTNYTATGLAILKQFGPHFTPANVADFWLSNIPIMHVCTAERIAYRNFCVGAAPPASASFRNPYREWIGAQIRADFWGYAAPGRPELAADFAWRDASISHVKNGIYGEMWAAAMTAAAFTAGSIHEVLEAGLGQIPANCRLAHAVGRVMTWHSNGLEYDDAVERVHAEWDETRGHDWCHTISNAMIVTLGLLYGGGDFGRSICRAVQPCFDTDCNGATVGSIIGILLGRQALPERWVGTINETLHTGVAGYHTVSLPEITRDSLKVIEAVQAAL